MFTQTGTALDLNQHLETLQQKPDFGALLTGRQDVQTAKLAFCGGCGRDPCCSSALSAGNDNRCNVGQLIRLSLWSSFA